MVSTFARPVSLPMGSGVFFDEADIRSHGRDERVNIDDFYKGVDFYYRLMKALTSGK